MPRNFTLTFALLCVAVTASAQEPPVPTPPTDPQVPAGGAPATAARPVVAPPAPAPGEPQPYEKVITKDAKSKGGIFTVHQVKDKYYYEIPKSELNKDFLWVSRIAKTTSGVGNGGQVLAGGVVRWE